MLRPSPHHADALESDDSASFSGLADVLEPDPDAVTSMRHLDAASVRSLWNLSSHTSRVSPPVSVRAPAQIQDFAFADTVFANDLPGDDPPDSGPIFVNDPMGNTQCVTPLAFRLPAAFPLRSSEVAVDFPTRMRVLLAHLRNSTRRSREEMRELWAGTAEMVGSDGIARPPSFLRRALALWSCFQWSSADLTRAALIGLAVLVTAAAIGAATMDLGGVAAAGPEVRAARTLDQHTGKKIAVRSKR